MTALQRYLRRADRPPPSPGISALLVTAVGTRLSTKDVQRTFTTLRHRARIEARSASCRPRLHDMRHSFAVATVLDAYQTDQDAGRRLALLATYPTRQTLLDLLVSVGRPRAHAAGRRPAGAPHRSALVSALAPTLEAFFTHRLIKQRHASQHTIAAYRDTIRLLLRFASERTRTPPSDLDITDLGAPLIGAFLDHLEHERGNSARSRNARLAAIRSLFRYAALNHPEHAATI